METKQFLSDNRELVIRFYNGNIKNDTDLSLKDFMIMLMNDFKHIVKVVDMYSEKNLFANMFEIESSISDNYEIGTTFSTPYSESNHAKSVNYYGKNKTNQFNNL
ncbi:hypothetical protein ACFQ5N_02285 [Lutibacter holmesii]|uniref:Uncharacterized protein n=1 Tax=Lutibacter holmesii TaxID=1137985 RepID=A0ABW3WKH6_9FLAO